MKKTFQIFRELEVPAKGEKVISEQLKENYTKCTGVFVTPKTARTNFEHLTMSLKVAQYEVLPQGTDLNLIAFNGNFSLRESIYDFTREGIPSKSSELDCVIKNSGNITETINLYLVLEND